MTTTNVLSPRLFKALHGEKSEKARLKKAKDLVALGIAESAEVLLAEYKATLDAEEQARQEARKARFASEFGEHKFPVPADLVELLSAANEMGIPVVAEVVGSKVRLSVKVSSGRGRKAGGESTTYQYFHKGTPIEGSLVAHVRTNYPKSPALKYFEDCKATEKAYKKWKKGGEKGPRPKVSKVDMWGAIQSKKRGDSALREVYSRQPAE